MFDTSNRGSLLFADFCQLWHYIEQWTGVFQSFDRDRSGSIDRRELNQCLQNFGYRLSDRFYSFVVRKYDRTGRGAVLFDDFILLCVTLQKLTAAFKEKDTDRDGYINIGYEEFLIAVMQCNLETTRRWSIILNARYFHGYVPQGQLDSLLTQDGDFLLRLVRPTQSPRWEELVVTLLADGTRFNVGVYVTYQGYFSINRLRFRSVVDLVLHFCNRGDVLPMLPVYAKLKRCVPADPEFNLLPEYLQLAVHSETGQVKPPVSVCSNEMHHQLLHEYNMLRRLHHTNILTTMGMVSIQEPLQLVTALAKHDDLRTFLTSGTGAAHAVDASGGRQLRLKLAFDATKALQYLERGDVSVVHTRVAARCCLVAGDNRDKRASTPAPAEGFKLVLTGFGYAQRTTQGSCELSSEHPLLHRWAAPELLAESPRYASSRSDTWSLGVLLWELFTDCDLPYGDVAQRDADVRPYVESGERLKPPVSAGDIVGQVMSACWETLPSCRITYDDIISKLQTDSDAPWN